MKLENELNLLNERETLASVYSPITARMAEEVGFKYGMVGGSVISMNLIGAPDVMLLTLSELSDSVRKICQASNLKIIVDGDAGYGNSINVKRLVEEIELAGASALTLEDTQLPAKNRSSTAELISVYEQIEKLETALKYRKKGSFGIIARTQMLETESLENFVERVQKYASLKIDAICLFGNRACQNIEHVAHLIEKPIMLISYDHEVINKSISNPKVKLSLEGHHAFNASLDGAYKGLLNLKERKKQQGSKLKIEKYLKY